MSTTNIPPEMASLLGQLKEATLLRDSQGNCIGLFTPYGVAKNERLDQLKSLFDLREAEQTSTADKEGYSIEEVKEYLRSLENAG